MNTWNKAKKFSITSVLLILRSIIAAKFRDMNSKLSLELGITAPEHKAMLLRAWILNNYAFVVVSYLTIRQ